MKRLATLIAITLLVLTAMPAHAAHRRWIPGVWITGYDLLGATASGLPAGPGICAGDPRVFRRGTRITIPSLHLSCRVEDTGVYGLSLDVWRPNATMCYAITGYRGVYEDD